MPAKTKTVKSPALTAAARRFLHEGTVRPYGGAQWALAERLKKRGLLRYDVHSVCYYATEAGRAAVKPSPFLDATQFALAGKFRRLVVRAKVNGIAVVVDSSVPAIRLVPAALITSGADLRNVGDTIVVDSACGGGSSARDPNTGAA